MQSFEIIDLGCLRHIVQCFAAQAIASLIAFRHNKIMSAMDNQQFASDDPVILIGASPVPIGSALAALPMAWPVVAVDGGAAASLAVGRKPHLILGDMDSLGNDVVIPDDVPVLTLDGQDDTDFQKALSRISASLIVGLGFLEARFDHSLAAVHALMCLQHDQPVMLVGTTDIMLRLTGPFAATLPVGSRFSVWPLGVQSFEKSSGLKWPLDGLTLAPGTFVGTSNEVSQTVVEIEPSAGNGYAVIVPLDALSALLKAF